VQQLPDDVHVDVEQRGERAGVRDVLHQRPLAVAIERIGEKVAATTAPAGSVVSPGTYSAPLLNIPSFKTGDDTKIKVDFTGALTGARANVSIKPKKDGPTEVKMNFHDLKDAPENQHFIVWAVGADGSYQRLGHVANTKDKNEAEINAETTLPDFGLLITMEGSEGVKPVGPAVATITIVP
jgi:hypothetical protein